MELGVYGCRHLRSGGKEAVNLKGWQECGEEGITPSSKAAAGRQEGGRPRQRPTWEVRAEGTSILVYLNVLCKQVFGRPGAGEVLHRVSRGGGLRKEWVNEP